MLDKALVVYVGRNHIYTVDQCLSQTKNTCSTHRRLLYVCTVKFKYIKLLLFVEISGFKLFESALPWLGDMQGGENILEAQDDIRKPF